MKQTRKKPRCIWHDLTKPLVWCRWPDVSGHGRSLVFFWLSRCHDAMSERRDVLALAAGELSPPITPPDDLETVTLFPCVWYPHHQTHRLSKPAVALRKGQHSITGGGSCCSSPRGFFFWGCKRFLLGFSNAPPGAGGAAELVEVMQCLTVAEGSCSHTLS